MKLDDIIVMVLGIALTAFGLYAVALALLPPATDSGPDVGKTMIVLLVGVASFAAGVVLFRLSRRKLP